MLVRNLKIAVYTVLIFVIGFASKTALENNTISEFLIANTRWIVVGGLAFLLFSLLCIILVFQGIPWLLRRKFGIALSALSNEEMLRGVADRMLLGEHDAKNVTPLDQQRIAIVRLGMWFIRREAIALYFSMLVTIGGGIVGTATVYLLIQQNSKLTLQTDATVVQALLLEGTRRATINNQVIELITQIEVEKIEATNANDLPVCGNRVNRACWLQSAGRAIYQLSDGLHERLGAQLRRSTPYHVIADAEEKPDYETLLRDQIKLGFESPERASILRAISRLGVAGTSLDFSFSPLFGADLSGAILNFAHLNNADLSAADLIGTNLREAHLHNADFSTANLSGAILENANFFDAVLTNANLTHADLTGANLRQANLRGTILFRANLHRSYLSGADLSYAILKDADLSGSDLSGAILVDTNLSGANLRAADLSDAEVVNVNVSGIELFDAILSDGFSAGAWAWSDFAPTLPGGEKILLCEFDVVWHNRRDKPNDCRE